MRARRFKFSDGDLERLYEEHSGDVLHYIARRVLDAQDAMDLMSETFATALASSKNFRGSSIAEARPWLFGIAGNLLRHYYRRGRIVQTAMRKLELERTELTIDEIAEIESFAQYQDLRLRVAAALNQLPDDFRSAVQMRAVQGMTYAETAARLGVTEALVRQRVSRGLRQLRAIVESTAPREAERVHG